MLLQDIYPHEEAQNISRLLLEHCTGIPPAKQLLPDLPPLNNEQLTRIVSMLERLLRHEPFQYVIGSTEFYGLKLKVSPAVLIPRPETEELVHWIINDFKGQDVNLVDVGTGSGCIALSLKKHLPKAHVSGLDVSEEALEVARLNAAQNQLEVKFIQDDVLKPSRHELYSAANVIVSNPPYVTRKEESMLARNVLDYEPHQALFVENNEPLLFYKHIFTLRNKKRHGCIYFEINEFLSVSFHDWLIRENVEFRIRKDLRGKERMVKIWW